MSQVQKLQYVDAKLGAPTRGQQTTRIVYNTQTPGAGTSVEFFKSFNGQTLGQTNLTQGKLDSMESMIIKNISFIEYNSTGTTTAFLANKQMVTCSVFVGGQQVVKDIPLTFQGGATGQPFDRLHDAASYSNGVSGSPSLTYELRMLTDIVIPPQVEFYVRLNTVAGSFSTDKVVCVLSGYGKIFSAGESF